MPAHSSGRDWLWLVWLGLLLLPALTTASASNPWDLAPWLPLAASVLLLLSLFTLLPRRTFLLLSAPLALLSVALVWADLWLNVNLLELLTLPQATNAAEVWAAVRPWLLMVGLATAGVALLVVALWRRPPAVPAMLRPALLVCWVAYLAIAPAMAVARAWPALPMLVGYASLSGNKALAAALLPQGFVDPRDPQASWNVSRAVGAATADRQTFILIVGESVRADRLPACGGRPAVFATRADALTFCDVTSGSDATHTSVPLLISRELPGHTVRVSSDRSVVGAFQEAGFATWWLGTQEQAIAWPEAQTQRYVAPKDLDRRVLGPELATALASAAPKKFIVLHAYQAHIAYRDRYDHTRAPFPVDYAALGTGPDAGNLPQWWNDYDNAIDESMRFVDAVIAAAAQQPGEAFVLYTPDHGENMLDDERGLVLHALRQPTHWDTTVPMVIWANPAWQSNHQARWAQLTDNRTRPAMHADVVPTLLGAADLRYRDDRTLPVDLGAAAVPQRERIVQSALGATLAASKLR